MFTWLVCEGLFYPLSLQLSSSSVLHTFIAYSFKLLFTSKVLSWPLLRTTEIRSTDYKMYAPCKRLSVIYGKHQLFRFPILPFLSYPSLYCIFQTINSTLQLLFAVPNIYGKSNCCYNTSYFARIQLLTELEKKKHGTEMNRNWEENRERVAL